MASDPVLPSLDLHGRGEVSPLGHPFRKQRLRPGFNQRIFRPSVAQRAADVRGPGVRIPQWAWVSVLVMWLVKTTVRGLN